MEYMSEGGISRPAKTTIIKERNGERERMMLKERQEERGKNTVIRWQKQKRGAAYPQASLLQSHHKRSPATVWVRPEFSNQLALTQRVIGGKCGAPSQRGAPPLAIFLWHELGLSYRTLFRQCTAAGYCGISPHLTGSKKQNTHKK